MDKIEYRKLQQIRGDLEHSLIQIENDGLKDRSWYKKLQWAVEYLVETATDRVIWAGEPKRILEFGAYFRIIRYEIRGDAIENCTANADGSMELDQDSERADWSEVTVAEDNDGEHFIGTINRVFGTSFRYREFDGR
jgi:hypothetical protein